MASVSPRTARIRGATPSEGAASYEKGDANGVAFFFENACVQRILKSGRFGQPG